MCNSEGRIVRPVDVATGSITSIQYYKDCIYTLCIELAAGANRHVIVYDNSYTELRRWSVADYEYISNIAVKLQPMNHLTKANKFKSKS